MLKDISFSTSRGEVEKLIPLLSRIPNSYNDILNEVYFPTLIKKISPSSTDMTQIKLLSVLYEKANWSLKKEIKKILLQKIIFLVHKIAVGPSGEYKSVVTEYKPGLDEIDIDATLENQDDYRVLNYSKIFCLDKIKQKGSYILMLDVSNSMYREKMAIAAIATGVFAYKLRNEFHGVMVFSREAKTIKRLDEPNNLQSLVDKMLEVKSGGATNIRLALLNGLGMLKTSRTAFKTGILVTDGWATVGGDPTDIASRYDQLHVLGISFGIGGSDPRTNVKMARAGKGKYFHVRKFEDLPLAIAKLLRK